MMYSAVSSTFNCGRKPLLTQNDDDTELDEGVSCGIGEEVPPNFVGESSSEDGIALVMPDLEGFHTNPKESNFFLRSTLRFFLL